MHISDLSSDVCSSDLEEGDDRLRAPPEKVAPQGIERWAPLEQKAGKCHSERFLAARIGLGTAEEIYQEAEGAKKCLHYWIEGGRAEVYQIDASRQPLAQIALRFLNQEIDFVAAARQAGADVKLGSASCGDTGVQ